MSTAAKQQAKNGSDAQRSAPKRKARGSHCQQGKGHRRRSKLTKTRSSTLYANARSVLDSISLNFQRQPEATSNVKFQRSHPLGQGAVC